jgi:predicted secreted protein
MIRLALALAMMWVLACSGCNDHTAPPPNPSGSSATTGTPGNPPPPPPPAAGEAVVRVEDDGKTFDVGAGATLTFKLASSAGTGYVWIPSGVDPAVLAQQGDRGTELSSNVPGAPKADVYRFTAQRPGSTPVQFDLQRPWAKTAPPAKTIHVIVNVH